MTIRQGSKMSFSKLEVVCALLRAGSKLGYMALHFQQVMVVKLSVSGVCVCLSVFLSVSLPVSVSVLVPFMPSLSVALALC